jgi:hypothetical protein
MDSVDNASSPDEIWTHGCLVDNIFVNLMKNGDDADTKSNEYVVQFLEKFRSFRIRSPSTFFEIDTKDLDKDTIAQINDYTKDCKTKEGKYHRLNGVIVDAIARIAKQAEPIILSSIVNEDTLVKTSLYQVREALSQKWRLVGAVKNNE